MTRHNKFFYKITTTALLLSTAIVVPTILTSCSTLTYYLLPFSIGDTFSKVIPDRSSAPDDLTLLNGTTTSHPMKYLPNSYIYEPNNFNKFLNLYGFAEKQEGTGKFAWIFNGLPPIENGAITNYFLSNISDAITASTAASFLTKNYTRMILNFITQTGITMGNNFPAWAKALFGEKFGGTGLEIGQKNSQEINDFYSFVLSNQQIVGEGKYNYSFDAYISNVSYSSSVFGPGPLISKDKYNNFVSQTDNEYYRQTAKSSTELTNIVSASFKPVPTVVDTNNLVFTYYDSARTHQSFKPTDWLETDIKKITGAMNTSGSWKSKKLKDIIGNYPKITGINYNIQPQPTNFTLPAITTDATGVLNSVQANLTPRSNLQFQQYSALVSKYNEDKPEGQIVYPYLLFSLNTYPIWTFYRIKPAADLNNLTLANSVEVDDTLFVDQAEEEKGSVRIFDINKVGEKFNKYFLSFYYSNSMKNNSDTPYENLTGDALRDRIYSLMFTQFALGNFDANGKPITTNSRDILSIY